MPRPSGHLPSILRRDMLDRWIYGWVRCSRRLLPGVPLEKTLAVFAQEFGIPPEQFNIDSQRIRYHKMDKEFREDQRTPAAT